MIALLVVVSSLDLASFATLVIAEPMLLACEVGPIGAVTAVMGPLGAVAWKCAGLAVVLAALAIAQPRHPRASRAVLLVALAVAAVGASANVLAGAQLLAAGWQPY